MASQLTTVCKTLGAYYTQKRPLSGVRPHVNCQLTRPRVRFVAFLTRVRFLPIVTSHVKPHMARVSGSILTKVTLEPVQLLVYSCNVMTEVNRACKFLVALVTLKLFQIELTMSCLVVFEIGRLAKSFTADFTHVRFFFSVSSQMVAEAMGSEESARTFGTL